MLDIKEIYSNFTSTVLLPIKDRKAETLIPLIKQFVSISCKIICTDKWKAYICLKNKGFYHFSVNSSKSFVETNNLNNEKQKMKKIKQKTRKIK